MSDTTATSDEDTTQGKVGDMNNSSKEHLSLYSTDISDMAIRVENENPVSKTGKRKLYSYKCTVCKKVWSNRVLLVDHYYSAHLNRRRHECKKCGVKFVNQSALCLHERTKHNRATIRKKSKLSAPPPKEGGSIEEHKKEISKVSACYNSDYLKIKKKCKYCDKFFRWRSNIHQHERKCHPEIFENCEFKCEVCQKGFKHSRSCKAHVTKVHNKINTKTPIVCYNCGDIFKNIRNKQEHLSGPDKCDNCGKTFSCKCELTQHKVSYFESCKCCACPHETYSNQFVLWKHMRKLHSLPLLLCCDNNYMRIKTYQKHMKLVHYNISEK